MATSSRCSSRPLRESAPKSGSRRPTRPSPGHFRPTLEIGITEGHHYIAMEYIGGRDLTQVLRRCQETQQRIPVPHAVYIAARIAEGLHFAHTLPGPDGRQLNIVNRDVSPSNVRLASDGQHKAPAFS